MAEAYIIDALRTPTGRRKGGLSEIHPADLGGHVLKTLVDRNDVQGALDGVPHEMIGGLCRCRMAVMRTAVAVAVQGPGGSGSAPSRDGARSESIGGPATTPRDDEASATTRRPMSCAAVSKR